MAKPERISISGIVAACSLATPFDCRSTARIASSITSIILASSPKALITRMPTEVSVITRIITESVIISLVMISRTFCTSDFIAMTVNGMTESDTIDSSGCW
ncbi:hypothetical protein GALL_456680 [mine drainage metagenome]|uniref:Uncharacterized protein n=1 Tax=mine drainage metagenome TaxID=410659 RepID=A0A1J5PNH3_9ZZZZ